MTIVDPPVSTDLASEDDSQVSESSTHGEPPLLQEYHSELDVQIFGRLAPENEPPGTSVHSFSDGGDLEMQLGFEDKPSKPTTPVIQHMYGMNMDLENDDFAASMRRDDRDVATVGSEALKVCICAVLL